MTRPVGQAAKTAASHAANVGSIPARVTIFLLTKGIEVHIMLIVEEDGKERKVFRSFLCLLSFSKESKLVLIAMRVHPFPSRTRKLSSSAPKILVWRRTGKIGNANTKRI